MTKPKSSKSKPRSGTKRIRINLAALTRVEWSAVVEVPASYGEARCDDLVRDFYDRIDGGEFVSAHEYWERGGCYHGVDVSPEEETEFRVDEDGEVTRLIECSPAEEQNNKERA